MSNYETNPVGALQVDPCDRNDLDDDHIGVTPLCQLYDDLITQIMMFVIRNDSNLEGSPPNTESSRRKGQVTLQPSRSRSRSNFDDLVRPGVLWQS